MSNTHQVETHKELGFVFLYCTLEFIYVPNTHQVTLEFAARTTNLLHSYCRPARHKPAPLISYTTCRCNASLCYFICKPLFLLTIDSATQCKPAVPLSFLCCRPTRRKTVLCTQSNGNGRIWTTCGGGCCQKKPAATTQRTEEWSSRVAMTLSANG